MSTTKHPGYYKAYCAIGAIMEYSDWPDMATATAIALKQRAGLTQPVAVKRSKRNGFDLVIGSADSRYKVDTKVIGAAIVDAFVSAYEANSDDIAAYYNETYDGEINVSSITKDFIVGIMDMNQEGCVIEIDLDLE